MKKCPRCNKGKREDEFDSQGKYCKICHNVIGTEWRRNNPESSSRSQKKYNATRTRRLNQNEKKDAQLGMPLGTAAHRMRRNFNWTMAVRNGEAYCFRCGKLIESPEEMSYDHVIDWLDSTDPKGLFFDCDNIRLSHLTCNRAYRRK